MTCFTLEEAIIFQLVIVKCTPNSIMLEDNNSLSWRVKKTFYVGQKAFMENRELENP